MEALYNILESSDWNAIVINARHMKAAPGRKTDVKDTEWIAVLLTHGLLRASYIPGKDQRELRELVRYRKSLVGERSRELNRLQKMLEGANIKISCTITDINGKSARNILEHILSGKQIDSAQYDIFYEIKKRGDLFPRLFLLPPPHYRLKHSVSSASEFQSIPSHPPVRPRPLPLSSSIFPH